MSIKNALIATRDVLGSINVPVILKEQITDKIDAAIKNITVCIDAISQAEQEEANANPDTE